MYVYIYIYIALYRKILGNNECANYFAKTKHKMSRFSKVLLHLLQMHLPFQDVSGVNHQVPSYQLQKNPSSAPSVRPFRHRGALRGVVPGALRPPRGRPPWPRWVRSSVFGSEAGRRRGGEGSGAFSKAPRLFFFREQNEHCWSRGVQSARSPGRRSQT